MRTPLIRASDVAFPLMLAAVDLQSPMTWAIVIGWIMSVVLHEFAHGVVAYLGGDYTIKERGGLTLNPFQYIDPVFSVLLPVLFLIMGGIPLPGGVTYIRRDLLRSRAWDSATSLAGPAMNFILFLACSVPFHPGLGWIETDATIGAFKPWQIFLAGTAQLQMMAVVLNLIPVPPLDGFGVLAPWLDEGTRIKLTTPPISTIAFLVFFMALWRSNAPMQLIYHLTDRVQMGLGFNYESMEMLRRGYNLALFGGSD